MGASADANDVGITGDDVYAGHGHAQKDGGDLRKASSVSLAARLRADDDVNAIIAHDRDLCALLRRADGGLDIVRKTASEQPAAIGGIAPVRLEAVPIGDAHGQVHVGLVLTA